VQVKEPDRPGALATAGHDLSLGIGVGPAIRGPPELSGTTRNWSFSMYESGFALAGAATCAPNLAAALGLGGMGRGHRATIGPPARWRATRRRFKVPKSKSTSKKAASTASKVLRDKRYSDAAKTAAGSALSQKKPKKK
jgi:hypothetical protein